MTAAAAPVRRVDPDRRNRIVDACLDVIAREGVAGTSHRRVASAADVPLGSMTYHFNGMEELLLEAFTRFADQAATEFHHLIEQATTTDEVRSAIANLINEDIATNSRDLVLTHELYTLAARQPRFRAITERWLARNHETLLRHFDPATARILDALIEGLTLHRALSTRGRDDVSLARDGIERVTS